jgi:hypothetical protein
MRTLAFIFFITASAVAQDVDVALRPDVLYVENTGGNITPMERLFFHIVVENKSENPVDVQWIRFDLVNSAGVVVSAQYTGAALIGLFDSSIDRKRIEATPKNSTMLKGTERKAISDIFMDLPMGFIGENLMVEVNYKSGANESFAKMTTPIRRMPGFSGRLPFDGIWYVSAEHGSLDPHKRFLAEVFAYDFLQIGANGKSFQREGRANSDYYAYGKRVIASKDGTVVFVRGDIPENGPGANTNTAMPGGNVVIIDHGNGQYGYYAHLRPTSISVKIGSRVRAGEPIGEVGNSGDSREPHLHFHVMNNPDPAEADGIPASFESWKAQSYGNSPSPRQQGVLPRGEFVQP